MKNRVIVTVIALLGLLLMVGALSAQADTQQPFLGITFDTADAGALVTSVVPQSPAADAGLQMNDVITAVNGDEAMADTLASLISAHAVGDTITLDVLRDDATLNLEATLQARPANGRFQIQPPMIERMSRAYLGVNLGNGGEGAVIASVESGSPADEAGLQADDIITAIDGSAISSPAEAAAAIAALQPGDSIQLDILRDGETMTMEATLGTRNGMPNMPGFDFGQQVDTAVAFDGQNWHVVALSDDSPLAVAGLKSGDIITAIDGESRNPQALQSYLEGLGDDTDVSLSVDREGETLEINVIAADLRSMENFGFFGGRLRDMPFFNGPNGRGNGGMQFDFSPFAGTGRLGVEFTTLDADIAAQHDLSVSEGALITAVVEDSPAAKAGLQVDDVIVAVSGDPVDAQRTLRERLLAYQPGDTVTLDVLRNGESLSLDVTLGEVNFENMIPQFFFGPDAPDFFNNGRIPHFFGPDQNNTVPAPVQPNL